MFSLVFLRILTLYSLLFRDTTIQEIYTVADNQLVFKVCEKFGGFLGAPPYVHFSPLFSSQWRSFRLSYSPGSVLHPFFSCILAAISLSLSLLPSL